MWIATLRKWVDRQFVSSRNQARKRMVKRYRPRLEDLEERCAPAVWTVTTSATENDTGDPYTFHSASDWAGADGKMSFEEAIGACEAVGYNGLFNPGPNTIDFNIQDPLPGAGFWTLQYYPSLGYRRALGTTMKECDRSRRRDSWLTPMSIYETSFPSGLSS